MRASDWVSEIDHVMERAAVSWLGRHGIEEGHARALVRDGLDAVRSDCIREAARTARACLDCGMNQVAFASIHAVAARFGVDVSINALDHVRKHSMNLRGSMEMKK